MRHPRKLSGCRGRADPVPVLCARSPYCAAPQQISTPAKLSMINSSPLDPLPRMAVKGRCDGIRLERTSEALTIRTAAGKRRRQSAWEGVPALPLHGLALSFQDLRHIGATL